MNKPFTVQVRKQDSLSVLDLSGEINAFAEADLNQAYEQAELLGTPTIALNFSQVTYINSTGIALFVGLLARARKSHRTLAVYNLSDHYREIFEFTRLADLMNIYSNESSLLDAAVSAG